jgi:phage shock protein C
LATVLLIFPGGLSLWAYIIGWIIIPQKPLVSETASAPVSGEGEATAEVPAEPGAEGQDKSGTIIGIVLVVLGFLFLLNASDIFRWFSFSKLWPIILIVIGIAVLVKALNKGGTNAS